MLDTIKTLEDLQAANLPHCDWRSFITVEGDLTPEETAALDVYFQHFLPPGPCVKCGAAQGGDALDGLLGRAKFTWGIAHGEGYCSTTGCGYPARAYHYNVGPIRRLEMILQYHPDECVKVER